MRESPDGEKWYIVHTYSGQEARAKQALLERAGALGMEASFDEILIPEESFVEMVKGQKKTSKRKFFPGYILVHMDLNDETWHVVKGTPKVTGFVGGGTAAAFDFRRRSRSDDAADEGRCREAQTAHQFYDEGESIRVISGPFANFSGFIDEVLAETRRSCG